MSAYYMMVKDGKITGGDGAPDECRALPGFHVEIPWAAICNQSAAKYRPRGPAATLGRRTGHVPGDRGIRRPTEPARYGPPSQGRLAAGRRRRPLARAERQGGGLHNIAATLQSPSPEYADLPTTEMRVPVFSAMTDEQKKFFLKMLAVEI